MQGKGLLKAFLILLSLVCLIQLFYFFPTNKVEKNADEYANALSSTKTGLEKDMAYKTARSKFLDSMSSEKIFSIPGLASYSYSELKQRQLNLGLDLKGGMSTLLEVDLSELLTALAGRNGKDPEFIKAIAEAKRAQRSEQSNFISLFVREYARVSGNKPLNKIFAQSQSLGEINQETSNQVVESLLRKKADETVDLTYKMLKERIDKLGVVSPNVSLDKSRDQIMVEMPGIENKQRARDFLEKSAQLEFWEVYRVSDAGISAALMEADKRLSGIVDTTKIANDTSKVASNGPLLSMLTLSNAASNTMGRNVFGLAEKSKRKLIDELLAKPEVANLFPSNVKFAWSYKPHQDEAGVATKMYELYALKPNADGNAPMDGEVVTSASPTQDQVSGVPKVALSMNSVGAKKWFDLTKKVFDGDAQGNQREIAITLDKEVVTSPSVNNGAISGGNSEISGSFNTEEAVDLSNILEVGKLPAKTNIVQESNVGPSLGKENISKSMNALLIGFLAVLLFMVVYYGQGGMVSIVSLLLNVIFLFGILSSLGTVLTLPGIAGIVLTMGMAVDANVIIYERIKEEIRAGKAKWAAIQDGFKASLSPIIDGNLTTLIVGLVLIYFGLGPIKGFGVVLVTGILTTLLTAVLVSNLLIDWWTKNGQKDMSFFNDWSKDTLTGIKIDWMGKRKYAYIFSGVLTLIGLVSIFTRGFDLGVDFKGGHSYTIQMPATANTDVEKLTVSLSKAFGESTIVKKIDSDNTFNVLTSYKVDETGKEVYSEVTSKLYEGLKAATNTNVPLESFVSENNNSDMKILSYNKVGSTVADDIQNSSWKAAIAALLLIFLYILIRFVRWQYSAGAVIATAHDALMTIGIFSLVKGLMPFSVEVDGAFVAAILTLIGYSINDTVIVFDRIREYRKLYPNMTQDEVYNSAINSTLSRTLYTVLTVLFVVIALFIFGGASIKNFAFALLIGVAFGTYSSVFIGTAIMRDLSAKSLGEKA